MHCIQRMCRHALAILKKCCPCISGMCRANAGQREDIEAEAGRARADAVAAAVDLSCRRRAAAGHLRVAVEACLAELAMAGSRFDVRIGWEPWPQVGCNKVGMWATPGTCRIVWLDGFVRRALSR